ncbi:MAG: hypothetical protein K0S32_3201 [Bacteroidetes bacterium]|nr:hypothetical protein [Bacteroidota bacterium]
MKHLTLALVVCTIGIIHSQTFRYYKVGQKFEMNDNACLVIKKDLRLLLHLESLDDYKDVKALKLVGFKDIEFDMDSVITLMSEFTKIKSLQFEDCDLNNLTEPLSFLPELKDVRILKGSSFNENFFFPLLKDNPVEQISIQASDPGLMTDSLHLLSQLKTISISSNNTFLKANKTITYVVGSKQNRKNIDLAYYGNFFRAETKPAKESKQTSAVASAKFKPKQLSCINQPIPGIDINDTLYLFNSTSSIRLQYESGSVINIDRNAFVTTDGQNYNGPVKVFYREFRNPVEIMLSGIPMTTKMNNETMLFKSGGMYEISAYDPQGNSLNTRSDSSVKIHFALTDTSENFQFYSLNDNGSWATTSPSVLFLKQKL